MNSRANAEQRQPSAVDQSKCQWLPAKVSVNKTGEKALFAGFRFERSIITAAQPCQDKDSGSICEVAIILDLWTAGGTAENAEVAQVLQRLHRETGSRPGEPAGCDAASEGPVQPVPGHLDRNRCQNAEPEGLPPVKTGFTLALGGPQCKDSKAQQAQAQSGDSDESSNSSGGLAGVMAGKLGGLFHKKNDAQAPAEAPAPTATPVPVPAGDVALMTVSSANWFRSPPMPPARMPSAFRLISRNGN